MIFKHVFKIDEYLEPAQLDSDRCAILCTNFELFHDCKSFLSHHKALAFDSVPEIMQYVDRSESITACRPPLNGVEKIVLRIGEDDSLLHGIAPVSRPYTLKSLAVKLNSFNNLRIFEMDFEIKWGDRPVCAFPAWLSHLGELDWPRTISSVIVKDTALEQRRIAEARKITVRTFIQQAVFEAMRCHAEILQFINQQTERHRKIEQLKEDVLRWRLMQHLTT